jgi:phosphoenolpyruvate-protein kinase (PTS system EI component)
MGSRLSHGAVVAREYRIPAVVNLEGVTRRLKDGQEVTVDGTRGIVWVHP